MDIIGLGLRIDSQGVEQGVNRLNRLDRAGTQAERSMSGLRTAAVAASGALAALGAGQLARNVYETVKSTQQLKASLETVTGSLESANAAWGQLTEFAKTTPFALDQSVKAFIRMKALGLEPTEDALRSFANTSAAMGTDLMQMIEAVADATTGEFERLKEYGIRASKDGEQLSLTFQGVTTTIKNNASEIQNYLESIGNVQFAGAAGDQMDTLGGKANNLGDSIDELYRTIGDAGATAAFEASLEGAASAVTFLNDNIDGLVTTGQVLTTLIAARLVPALGGAAAALATKTAANIADARAEAAAAAQVARRTGAELATAKALLSTARLEAAATKGTNAHAFALNQLSAARVRATTAAGAHTTAVNASTAAMARASVGARALTGAMAALGGPLGILIGGAGLLYVFRDELNLTGHRAGLTAEQIEKLREEMAEMSQEDLSQSLASLNAGLDQATLKAARAREELAQLRSESRGFGALGFDDIGEEVRGMQAVSEAQEDILELNQAIDVARAETASRIEENANALVVYADRLDETSDTAKEAAEATKTLGRESNTLDTRLNSLLNTLSPSRQRTQQYAQTINLLNTALASGRITFSEYQTAMIAAQDAMADTEDASNDLADTVEADSDLMTEATEGFLDAFERGAIESFDDVGDYFTDLLGDMVRAAAANEIRMSLGMDASGMMSGGFGDLLGAGKSLFGMGGGASGAASTGLYANAATGAAQGGLYGNVATGGLASGGGLMSGLGGAASAMGPAAAIYAGVEAANWLDQKFAADAKHRIDAGGLGVGVNMISKGLFGGDWEAKDAGLMLGASQDGLSANQYTRERKSGGLFSGSSYRINESELEGNTEAALQQAFEAQKAAIEASVEMLGIQKDQLGSFEAEVERIDTRGMDEGEVQEAIQDWMSGVMDDAASGAVNALSDRMRDIVSEMDGFDFGAEAINTAGIIQSLVNVGDELGGAVSEDIFGHLEGVIETGAQSVSSTVDGLADALDATVFLDNASDRLNLTFDATADGAIHAAFAMREISGGLENLSQMQGQYYQNFFTEAEQSANLQDDITDALAEQNLQLPETRDAYRDLVEAQDLNTEAGRENYATLLKLAGSFSELIPATQGATNAVEDNADAQRERAKLERDLLKLQGDADELRRRELASLDKSNRGLQSHIYLYDDATSAMDALGDSVDKRVSELNSAMNAEIDMARAGYEQRIAAAEEAFNEEQRFNEKRIESTRESISELSSLTQMLSRAAGRASVDTPALSMSRRQRGRSFVANAAQSGGLPDAGALETSLDFAGGDAEQFYSSFDEYMKDQLETQAHIRELEQRAEGQLSTEEAALEALLNQNEAAELQHRESINQMQRDSEDTVDALREQYAAQIAQIEQQQINAERQYNAIRGVDDSVRSVGSAVRAVESAISAVAAANSESAGSMSVGAFANGGNHAGGWRVVGERGPELEWTPPSRIMSNQSSTSQLNTEAVRQAVDMMRVEMSGALSGILTSTRETASLLDDWDAIGQPAVRSVDA